MIPGCTTPLPLTSSIQHAKPPKRRRSERMASTKLSHCPEPAGLAVPQWRASSATTRTSTTTTLPQSKSRCPAGSPATKPSPPKAINLRPQDHRRAPRVWSSNTLSNKTMKDMLPNRAMNLRALRGHREHSAAQDHEGPPAPQDHQAGRLESGLHSRSFNAESPAKLHRPQGHTKKNRTTQAASISDAMAVQFGPRSLLHTVRALFTDAENSQGAIGFERAPVPLLHTMRAFFTLA